MPHPFKLTSLWCIPASHADTVLVMASYSNTKRGLRHLMRWTPGASLEPGVWTSALRFARRYCTLDPTGKFLRYSAKTLHRAYDSAKPSHFRGSVGGGVAISRCPWISALTDVQGNGWDGIRGGGPSRHALSPEEQAKLWAMFPASNTPSWFTDQQPGWTLDTDSWNWPLIDKIYERRYFGTEYSHIRPWFTFRSTYGRPSHGSLLARLPERYGGDITDLQFAWASPPPVPPREVAESARPEGAQSDGLTVHPLPNVVWAHLRRDDTLLTATRSGLLQWHTRRDCTTGDLAACWQLRESLDCSERKPNPTPSPDWARAPL